MKTLTVSTLVLIVATAGAQAQLGGVTETAGSVRQSTELGLDPTLDSADVRGVGNGLSRIDQMRADRARRAARRASQAAEDAAPQASASAQAGAEASAAAVADTSAERVVGASAAADAHAAADAAVQPGTTPSLPQRVEPAVRDRVGEARARIETTSLPAPQSGAVVRADIPETPDVSVETPAPRVAVSTPAPAVRQSRTVYVAPAPAPLPSRSTRVETRTEIVRETTGARSVDPAPANRPDAPGPVRRVAGAAVEHGLPLCIAALLILGLILAARELTRPRGRSA
ncbi:hypothetical protein [Maricaulis sp. W15]|uniref:Uncharacterized protein n=2 Tax=Maricaulis maris TaxID=74318 RepID=A0A495DG22_9PROT|nr:hypothetical protein [Maricaulis sp. W15]RKR00496.1 hypothetical protein C7435_1704 [Maricaulis maris]